MGMLTIHKGSKPRIEVNSLEFSGGGYVFVFDLYTVIVFRRCDSRINGPYLALVLDARRPGKAFMLQ